MGPASGIYLDGGSVSTSGNQTYAGTVVLGADTTLTSSGGLVDFASTIDGAHNLTVSATSGAITFGGDVGTGTALASLTAEGQTISVGNVTTTGNIYLQASDTTSAAITFGSGTTLNSGSATTSLLADWLQNSAPTTIDAGTFEFAAYTPGMGVELAGNIYSLADLNINATNIRIGAVTVPGSPSFGPPDLDVTANSIWVTSAYNVGSANLQFDTISTGPATGWVRLEGPITAGSFTDNAAGTTRFDLGGSVTTTMGAPTLEPGFNYGQTYAGPVVLDVDTTLTSADNVIFASTVDGGTYSLSLGHSLSPGAAGLTISSPDTLFGGNVGGNVALGSLSVSGLAVDFERRDRHDDIGGRRDGQPDIFPRSPSKVWRHVQHGHGHHQIQLDDRRRGHR